MFFCVCLCCSHVLHEQSLKSIRYQEEAEQRERQTVEWRLPVTYFCWTVMTSTSFNTHSDLIDWYENWFVVCFKYLICARFCFHRVNHFDWGRWQASVLFTIRMCWRWKSPVIVFPALPDKETSDTCHMRKDSTFVNLSLIWRLQKVVYLDLEGRLNLVFVCFNNHLKP